MKKTIQYFFLSILILAFLSCTKKDSKDESTPKPATKASTNLRLGDTDATTTKGYYPTRSTYVPDLHDNYFSIRHFSPSKTPPTPLIIAIHGGAFIGGKVFTLPVTVGVGNDNSGLKYVVFTKEQLNNQGFALASIDYSLINSEKKVINEHGEQVKLTSKNTLEDCQDFLNYIIANAGLYNVDTTKIILMGFSGGASTSLWLGLDNAKGYENNIKGIIALSPQASLNLPTWRENIFAPFYLDGLYDSKVHIEKPLAIGPYTTGQYFNMMYGTADINEVDQYCTSNNLNFLKLIDETDPELFLACLQPADDIVHNRAHVFALQAKASNKQLKSKIAYIYDPYYFDPSENAMQFCIRKFK